MHPELSPEALTIIDQLCAEGCSSVNHLLEQVRNGGHITALDGFDEKEVVLIIEELTQIMAVYEKGE